MASLTASRSNGTCIDLHDCAVRLLSYCVAPFLSYCVETGPWSALGIAARTPLQIDSALLRSSLFQHLCSFVSFSSGELASASQSLCRGLGSRWFTERFHSNALVTPFQHGSGILYCPAREGLRCHPLPTSSTRAPEVTPN
jgi:hypothetical protein